jgi:mRNA interferase RelE/StbE
VYRLEVSPAADRNLDRLKRRLQRRDFERLRAAIRALADEPRPQGARKIRGAERAFRIRVGSYRVVYEVYDSQKLVLILQATRRAEATYRQ